MKEGSEHFVTCFDSYFMPQGFALYESLSKHYKGSVLWVICLDKKSFDYLQKCAYPMMRTLFIEDLENEKLKSDEKKQFDKDVDSISSTIQPEQKHTVDAEQSFPAWNITQCKAK